MVVTRNWSLLDVDDVDVDVDAVVVGLVGLANDTKDRTRTNRFRINARADNVGTNAEDIRVDANIMAAQTRWRRIWKTREQDDAQWRQWALDDNDDSEMIGM